MLGLFRDVLCWIRQIIWSKDRSASTLWHIFGQSKRFYRRCWRKITDTSYQSLAWRDMSASPNSSITAQANLQLLDLMKLCDSNWKCLEPMGFTRQPYVHILFKPLECLKMSTRGKLFKLQCQQCLSLINCLLFRWVNTLNSNDVADRIITAVRRNDKCTLIPWYFSILLTCKWWVDVVVFVSTVRPKSVPKKLK